MDRSWRWTSWLLLATGGLIVAGGLALGYGSLKLVLYGEHAPGIAKQIVRNGDVYEPVSLHATAAGSQRSTKLTIWAGRSCSAAPSGCRAASGVDVQTSLPPIRTKPNHAAAATRTSPGATLRAKARLPARASTILVMVLVLNATRIGSTA